MPRPARQTPPPPAGSLWIKEAALYVGLSVNTLYKYRQNKTGPRSYAIGRKVAYQLSALNEYLVGQQNADREPTYEMRPAEPRRAAA